MRVRVDAVLDASPKRVWAVLADWERQAEWMPDVAWIRVLGPEREGGARLAVKTKVLGIPAVVDRVDVTVWEPPRRLGVEHRGFVRGWGEWRLEPTVDGRTTFGWLEDITMPPAALGELAIRAYGPVQRAMLRRSVRRLGEIVRGGG